MNSALFSCVIVENSDQRLFGNLDVPLIWTQLSICQRLRSIDEFDQLVRGSIVVSIPACHAGDLGLIPGIVVFNTFVNNTVGR